MRRGRPRNGGGNASESDGERAASANERANIPTDLLRTFVAICELGSFTKAAHLFDLTQPAVSAHMRRLEAIIGADLLEKSLAGVALTDTGSEVLRHARRILSINDQIVVGAGQRPDLQVVRIGIPNLYAPTKLARILDSCGGAAGEARVQIRCDHSSGLMRSVRAGYLDLAFAVGIDEAMKGALATWSTDLVWIRSPDFVLKGGAQVPLISSPNLLYPDRTAMAVLDKANRRYEIVFTAFDTSARRAAAEAGLGYIPIPRTAVTAPLVIETDGVLPELPKITLGIIAREDFDTKAMAPLIAAFKAAVTDQS
jgi:DNA-binding transcriptional LysR family regulator